VLSLSRGPARGDTGGTFRHGRTAGWCIPARSRTGARLCERHPSGVGRQKRSASRRSGDGSAPAIFLIRGGGVPRCSGPRLTASKAHVLSLDPNEPVMTDRCLLFSSMPCSAPRLPGRNPTSARALRCTSRLPSSCHSGRSTSVVWS
jgi:hypothetical protein